ncbi:hypothetical protein [Aliidiomarina sanyensis]|uniref:Uncharacterized protein n=1 Tax=Aliidiomarina sanyensis TaxID=1249555 RepID=A0A432WIE2_9GAMM|nr:hypothetical protein [Aliidiomarina sanyensis]RUO33515.1 hypothetical protein CWE11_06655 [Aliidiomarina sanyensis]
MSWLWSIRVAALCAMVIMLSACGRAADSRSSWPEGELPTIAHMQRIMNDFQLGQWRGCNVDMERGSILGVAGYQNYWVCRGTTSSEHRYAITIFAAPGNETGQQIRLEFRRGYEPGMIALLGVFFHLAGVDHPDERMRMRSDVSRYLITPPDIRDMVQASLTPNNLIMYMGYNMPRSGYTTLEINARPQIVELDALAD